jgi:hypothetical protein
MYAGVKEDERLVRFTKICLGLPRAEREMMGSHADFKVKEEDVCLFPERSSRGWDCWCVVQGFTR